jgi:hypothetical protein
MAIDVFPHPDSPTSPNDSPDLSEKDTFSMAETSPFSVR